MTTTGTSDDEGANFRIRKCGNRFRLEVESCLNDWHRWYRATHTQMCISAPWPHLKVDLSFDNMAHRSKRI